MENLGILPRSDEYMTLSRLQDTDEDAMFVVLSDVHLDKPDVFQKLQILFEGLSEAQPTLFLFIGNFLSRPFGHSYEDSKLLTDGFNELANTISLYPNLAKFSQFVFVPGLHDPGSGYILPRPKIPAVFTQKLRAKIQNVVFTSNPCRIRFYTQVTSSFSALSYFLKILLW